MAHRFMGTPGGPTIRVIVFHADGTLEHFPTSEDRSVHACEGEARKIARAAGSDTFVLMDKHTLMIRVGEPFPRCDQRDVTTLFDLNRAAE